MSLSQAWARATVMIASDTSTPSESFEGAPQDHKFLVKAVYTGKLRKIGPTRLNLITKWGKAMRSEDFAGQFQDEIEVRADRLTVWLALQDVIVEPFRREARSGTPIQLWMMYIGAAQQDRVFLVNEFKVVK
jgi:hypothetical protein